MGAWPEWDEAATRVRLALAHTENDRLLRILHSHRIIVLPPGATARGGSR